MRKHINRFVKFGIASGIATIFDMFLLWVFVEFAGLFYLLSAVIGFLGGSCLNYGINRAWTFKESKVAHARGLISFIIIGAVGLIWTILLMALLVEVFGIHYLIARIISAFFVLVWNYVMNRILTFK